MGGPSAEREVSLNTGKAVVKALQEKGYQVVEVDLNEGTAAVLREQKVEVVYNALHGKWGEDGCAQGLLEILRIPYTGPGVTGSALGMDKPLSKRLFEAEGLRVPPYRIVKRGEMARVPADDSPFGWPVVTKPATEGSSVGVAVCADAAEFAAGLKSAFANDTRALVEQFIAGREINVAVLGEQALGVVEVRPKPQEGEGATFYDYEHKYTKGMTEYLTKPDDLSADLVAQAEQMAVQACRAILAEGICRVDLILDEDERFWLLEVNTLPGLTELSLVPMIIRDWRGIGFADLVEMVLKTARLKIGT